MPFARTGYYGPNGNVAMVPNPVPLNGPGTLILLVAEPLANQYGFSTTSILFTRPDGALISSSDITIGTGYVFQRPDGVTAIITFQFGPGVLNQPGTWSYTISDTTIPGGPFAPGTFQVSGHNPVEDLARTLPPMKILAFDDSCTVYTLASPSSFQTTPPTTLADNWVDMTVAVNDGSSAYALWSEDVSQNYNPAIFDSTRGGVEIVLLGQSPTTATIYSYSKGVGGDANWLSSTSGAFSANGTLLVPISEWAPTNNAVYPRISRDFGQTWTDVTGLPITGGTPGNPWTRACFSARAQIMYIHRYKSFIYKSVDGGVTWNALTNGPTFSTEPGNIIIPGLAQNSMRLRCSSDGSVIAGIDWGGQFWISKDGGATWSHTDFATLSGAGSNILSGDFSMPIDGSKFIVTAGIYFASGGMWTSFDGINWTERTVKLPGTIKNTAFSSTQQAPFMAFISPAGDKSVVAYAHASADDTKFSTDASYTTNWHNRFGTWVNQPVTINSVSKGNLVAAAMVPA